MSEFVTITSTNTIELNTMPNTRTNIDGRIPYFVVRISNDKEDQLNP